MQMMFEIKYVVSIIIYGLRSNTTFTFRSLYTHSSSKFAKFRPMYCILAGASGTHSVCVCTILQTCKLMLGAINLKELEKT